MFTDPKIRRQPQRQAICGGQHAGANSGGVLRTRVNGLGVLEDCWLLSFGRKKPEVRAVSGKKIAVRRGTARYGARQKKTFDANGMFIVERNFPPSDRLLHFARANLPQGGGAAQSHVAAGITVVATVPAREPRVPRTGHLPDWLA